MTDDGDYNDTTPEGRSPLHVLVSIEASLDVMSKRLKEINEKLDKEDTNTNFQHSPWQESELTETQWYALLCVKEYDGHPQSKHIEEKYLKRSGRSPSDQSTYRVGARLKELYDMGYVDRTPSMPYVYWLTDAGKQITQE